MTLLVIENGTGVVGANSYTNVLAADNYITVFLPELAEAWLLESETQKEVRLIRAAKFIETMGLWASELLTLDQGLVWPRKSFTDRSGRVVEGVPSDILLCQITLAASSVTAHLTAEYTLLTSEKFGDSSETYARGAEVRTGGNSYVREWLNYFVKTAYAKSTSIVEFERA
jgi:hypothetical protein